MLPARLPCAIDTRRLRSFDGTEIAYHVTEAPYPGAPWIVLANGLGGSVLIWRRQIEYLRDRYRFVSWDYRGLYASERPRPERPDSYALVSHVRDLAAVLAAERIERAGFIGWSLGVQVVLEAFPRLPGRAQSLVLVNGGAGRPLDGLTPLRGLRAAIPPFLEVARRARSLGPSAHLPIGEQAAAAWLRRLGLVGPTIDPLALAELTTAVAALHPEPFLRNLRAFAEHDARGALAAVDVPALIIAGDHDPLTRPEIPRQMARRISGAETLVVPGGAHLAPLEYPELVSLRIERFYRERGL